MRATNGPAAVLVTGASGFLGRHLLPKLTSAVALVRSTVAWNGMPHFPELRAIPTIEGDVEQVELWLEKARAHGISTIVHMAALVRHSRREAAEVHRVNVQGTVAMVKAAAQLGARMVLVSTSGTVGCFHSPDQIANEQSAYCKTTITNWPYYDSKLRAEVAARETAASHGVELVIVRLPVLLGPGDHRGRSTSHIRRVITGRQRYYLTGGIAYTDVRDVAQALVTLTTFPQPRPVYHLPGVHETLEVFFRRCATLAKVDPPKLKLPKSAALVLCHAGRLLGSRSPFPDPVLVEMASCYWGFGSLWANEIGYQARSAEETLTDTINWLCR